MSERPGVNYGGIVPPDMQRAAQEHVANALGQSASDTEKIPPTVEENIAALIQTGAANLIKQGDISSVPVTLTQIAQKAAEQIDRTKGGEK